MIYISYPSALEYWLTRSTSIPFTKVNITYSKKPDVATIREIGEMLCLSLPLSLTVADSKQQGQTSACRYKIVSKNIPEKCFLKIGPDIAVASPELCFIMAAKEYSFPRLVELGNTLCASYFHRGSSLQSRINPISSVAKIRHFINKAPAMHGIKNARVAINYVANNSRSPVESKLLAVASLPLCRGGYGTDGGIPNGRINLSKAAQHIYGYKSISVDILFRPERVAVEYDSNEYHSSPSQLNKDNSRKSILNQIGYSVCTITSLDLKYFNSIEKKFIQLRKMLGLRSMKNELNMNQHQRHETLKDLFMNDKPIWTP